MILKTFNLQSVADRMQKSGTDPGATTTCPRSVADRMQKSGTDPGTATTCPTRSVADRMQKIRHWFRSYYDLPAISSRPRPINHAYICAASPRARLHAHTTHNTHTRATTHTRRAPPGRNPFRGCFYRATAHMRIRTHMTAHAYTRVGTVRASRATTGAVTPPFL